MTISKIKIRNYRSLSDCDVTFNSHLNIIVGDNEAGKSTLLECISLALTGQINGRPISMELHPLIFSTTATDKYLRSIHEGSPTPPPAITIEVFFDDVPELAELRGNGNSDGADVPGVCLRIEFDDAYKSEYAEYISEPLEVRTLPVEYYHISMQSFARKVITARSIPITPVFVDASRITTTQGANRYVASVVKEALPSKEQVQLALSYRKMRDAFLQDVSVRKINDDLASKRGAVSDKLLSISLDETTRGGWESGIVPTLDGIPISMVGKGEQNTVKIRLALERNSDAHAFLIEEPENHLSHSRLNGLLEKIIEKAGVRQVFITTHSSFVLNKLGINNLLLFRNGKSLRLNELSSETYAYFKKLPGHDTLRLVLSARSILVEGPSDELVVQKAFIARHGATALERGVDIISVKSLAFKRFLEIARKLSIPTSVVTDNDGDVSSLKAKYSDFDGVSGISILYDTDEDFQSLEAQLLKANGLALMNRILGKSYTTETALVKFMTTPSNKTDVALAVFETAEAVKFPEYINAAVK